MVDSSSSSEDTISFSDATELLKLMDRMVLGGEDDPLRDGDVVSRSNGKTDGPDSDELVPADECIDPDRCGETTTLGWCRVINDSSSLHTEGERTSCS